METIDIQVIPEIKREELNHEAYLDVLNGNQPTRRYNEFYMHCYRQWYALNSDPFDMDYMDYDHEELFFD
jgi:hypothetical protein